MRLQFFIPSLTGGGAERVLSLISDELVNRGHIINIVITNREVSYNLNDKIILSCIKDVRHSVEGGFFRKTFIRAGNYIRYKKQACSEIKRFRPDLIVTFMESQMIPILLSHGSAPIVSSEHNTMSRNLGRAIYFQRFFLNKFFDKVTVLTSYDKEYAIKKGLKKTVVINNPLTYKPIGDEEYERLFGKRKNILACGRINSWEVKGFDLLIKSFALLAKKVSNVELDIVGAGEDKDINHLKELASEQGVSERVNFLGFRNDIDSLMKSHSVFVLSSRAEGFGMVLIEAMSQGLPCVSFALPGPREIIQEGIDGLLVEEQNCDKMAESIGQMLGSEELRYRMGNNGVKNVGRFSLGTITNQWEQVFNELVR